MITAGPTGATPQKGPPRTSVSPASNTPPPLYSGLIPSRVRTARRRAEEGRGRPCS